VYLFVLIPLLIVLGVALLPQKRQIEIVHLIGSSLFLIGGIALLYKIAKGGPQFHLFDYVYLDSLSAFMLLILVLVAFVASLYTVGYIRHAFEMGDIEERYIRHYYIGFHLFVFTMAIVMLLNNLALMWIAIELTTLVSALLIAFYRKSSALEAAWKYLIIGSLGIVFALFGILFLFASAMGVVGETYETFQWTVLFEAADSLDPTWVVIAFVFVLIGYGTKAGLAPMHFWLPDAHSEAPSPASALLSGMLLNTALYGIIRVYLIAHITLGTVVNQWLIGFGLLSIGLMVPFILVQENLKRMLAYSSVEHIGIITFGIGIGGPVAVYGAILHMLNHSLVKSILFLSAGNIDQKYGTKDILRITGVLRAMPLTGIAFIIGVLAIAGAPPFNIFLSEFTIMLAGFKQGFTWLTSFYILFILLIFAGMTYFMSHIAFGKPEKQLSPIKISRWSKFSLIIPLFFILILGLYVPDFINQTLENIIVLFEGVHVQ